MIEIPLPTPSAVISSPSHIKNAVPAVRTIAMDDIRADTRIFDKLQFGHL